MTNGIVWTSAVGRETHQLRREVAQANDRLVVLRLLALRAGFKGIAEFYVSGTLVESRTRTYETGGPANKAYGKVKKAAERWLSGLSLLNLYELGWTAQRFTNPNDS